MGQGGLQWAKETCSRPGRCAVGQGDVQLAKGTCSGTRRRAVGPDEVQWDKEPCSGPRRRILGQGNVQWTKETKSNSNAWQSSTLTELFTAITTVREYHGRTFPKWRTGSPHTPLCHSADPHATARKEMFLFWRRKEKRAAQNAIFVVLPKQMSMFRVPEKSAKP